MALTFGSNNMITRFVYETANFASGGGTTTLGWQASGTAFVDFQSAASTISLAFGLEILPLLDSDITVSEIQWESEDYSGVLAVGTPGGASVTSPPPNAAVLFTHRGNGKGPRYRGRSFMPGLISETSVDERGVIGTPQVSTLQTAWEDFIDAATVQPGPVVAQCIPQSTTSGEVTPAVVPWPQVINSVCQPVMATQRRRLRR